MESLIKPKKPKGQGWFLETRWRKTPDMVALGYEVISWSHETGLFVLSAVEKVTPEPGQEDVGPEYHLSISYRGGRCDKNQAKFVLEAFGLEDATEDNHVPGGKVRNYWRPVADKFSGIVCPCQDEEPAIVEDKGDFIWRGVPK